MKEVAGILAVAKRLVGSKPTIEELKAFIKKESWFDIEEEHHKLICSTRDHGDVGEEQPGMEDVRMAKKVGKLLLDKFGPTNLKLEFEAVDEWIYMTVIIR